MFLRNASWLLTDYRSLYSRKYNYWPEYVQLVLYKLWRLSEWLVYNQRNLIERRVLRCMRDSHCGVLHCKLTALPSCTNYLRLTACLFLLHHPTRPLNSAASINFPLENSTTVLYGLSHSLNFWQVLSCLRPSARAGRLANNLKASGVWWNREVSRKRGARIWSFPKLGSWDNMFQICYLYHFRTLYLVSPHLTNLCIVNVIITNAMKLKIRGWGDLQWYTLVIHLI
jgi:hypothetical protein